MRGKLREMERAGESPRIIPAHAGQTHSGHAAFMLDTDHPRACGANSMTCATCFHGCGSSPRMRGKRLRTMPRTRSARIIPAHAGQTVPQSAKISHASDHPRACGANTATNISVLFNVGSSPRMRGKLVMMTCDAMVGRIIPAHAGQTVRFYAKTLERWTLNNWIRTVAPIFVLLFLPPVIGQNAYIERHYSNQSFSWFSKLHYASAFDLSLVA